MFDVFYIGNKPGLFAHEREAKSLEHAAELSRTKYYWYIYGGNDYSNFDFDYVPPPWESEHLHTWPTQWHQYGGAYLANQDTVTQRQYNFKQQVVNTKPTTENWVTLHTVKDFDYSWQPHPMDPPYIYVFGNQWYGPEQMPTVEYHVPGATERKYLYEPQARLPVTQDNWVVNSDVPVEFDFSWCPDPHDPPYIYVFGNQHWEGERSSTVEYHVPGATERKYIGDIRAKLSTLDIFYVDYINPNSTGRYETLKEKYPHVQKVRYANSIMDTIKRCVTRSKTARFWVISSKNNYAQFDFDWQPDPWQHSFTHVFPSQWNKWSDTFLINRWEFERHSKWARGLEEFPNLNFVSNQQVRAESDGSNIYYVDHGNDNNQFITLQKEYPKIKSTRFVDNYLDTFKRIMATADTEYVWIVSSICNYDTFDFTWHPEAWQSEMIHVFASGSQRRGDTFYIHVDSFKKQMYELELLDWFNVINYCEDQSAYRLEAPTIVYDGDSLVEPVKNNSLNFPYAIFRNSEDDIGPHYGYPCLWAAKDRVIIPITSNKSSCLIPREARGYVETQIYDYPFIQKEKNEVVYASRPLDIIFISNGEPDEQMMFEHTQYMTDSDVKWVRGVNGRVAAYQAAARASSTPWFFAVFAKLEVTGNTFPWYDWQPDYFQEPKHYIFNARNPVNGLVYGHQGMIAYNKKLVLENNHPGIDFTLSQPHESVPLLSGTARFNQDPWMTWRTAFREVVKLKHFMSTQPTLETEFRLDTWLSIADGDYAEWCLRGAADAVAYYDEVGGNYEKLMLSFEWAWLANRFKSLYNV